MSELKFFEYSNTKTPKNLVIFLHGYGASGENLIELAREFEKTLPEAHFISPNGIEPCENGFPGSYQWFSLFEGLERKGIEKISKNIINSNQILRKFIKNQLNRFNLLEKDLFLMGFSQGAMMSMYQGLTMEERPSGIVSFSGRLILPSMTGEKIIQKPDICLIHGRNDTVLTFDNFIEAEKILKMENIPFESHAIDHLEHSINLHGVRSAQNFVKKLL